MIPLRKDTLEYQMTRPGVLKRDMSAASVKEVVKAMTGNQQSKEYAEVDGLRFYMGNHAVMLMKQKFLPKEPMGEKAEVLSTYHKMLASTAPRMFHYLLKICTREMRHTGEGSGLHAEMEKYGDVFWNFYKKIKGGGSHGAVSDLMHSAPNMTLGDYTDAMYDMFRKGHFSGGFGGKAWAEVTHCLREFVHGRYSAEMMMDTAFTLCHNNGPIFNKGMEFHGYTPSEIIRILDVQRSGQIPQYIREKFGDHSIKGVVQAEYAVYEALIGEAFRGYVDWYVVEGLGAVSSYPSEKQTQVSVYGQSKAAAKVEKMQKAKHAAAEAEKAKKLAEEEKKYYTVSPGIKVKKIVRDIL